MVKAYYVCEVCHRTYDTLEAAEECENGIPLQSSPKGMIFGNHRIGTMYSEITFAVCKDGVAYACRDNQYGDSLGGKNGSLCDAEPCKGRSNNYLDITHPTFKRMVSFLQSKGIPVTIWDGEEVLSIEQYISRKE